jgi:ribosomal protein L7Ae-like RNA K-turn-binding protein
MALLRFVLAGDPPELVPDVQRRAPGRGVSVHPSRRCLELAVRSGALRRGLRTEQAADAGQLATWAAGQYTRRVAGLLTAAYSSGRAVFGSERVRAAITSRGAKLLIVASDASDQKDELIRAAERLGGNCLVHGDKASLGRLFGREMVAVVAVMDSGIARELQHAARCAAELIAEAS